MQDRQTDIDIDINIYINIYIYIYIYIYDVTMQEKLNVKQFFILKLNAY